MIAYLTGNILEISMDSIVLDVNGVGYELTCSGQTLADVESQRGRWGVGASSTPDSRKQQLFVYTHVREDALQLFGFSTIVEKKLFLSLLKVNGIGPKMAITILSGASSEQLEKMIEKEDVKALSQLPKVGKKTAEQMILTLKGKLVLKGDEKVTAGKATSKKDSQEIQKVSYANETLHDISSALVNLGFKQPEVLEVVRKMPENVDLQEGIRQGLFALSRAL